MSTRDRLPFIRLVETLERLSSSYMSNKTINTVMGFGFLLFLSAVIALAIIIPGYPYDLVPYLASSLSGTTEEIHAAAWGMVQNSAPAEIYRELASSNEYRLRQSTDPKAFASTIPLYEAKIGYTTLLKLLGPYFGWMQTAFSLNLIAATAIGIICFIWMKTTKSLQCSIIVIAVLLAGNFVDFAAYPSPDTIASALLLAGIFIWLRSNETVALILFYLAFLMRPDTIIFAFALILASLAFNLKTWRLMVLFVLLIVSSIAIRQLVDHPGWWVHYYFSTVTIQNTLENFSPAFSVFDFLKGQARGVYMSLTEFNWPVMLIFISTAIIAMVQSGYQFSQRQSAAVLACILTIGGKFMVFPLPDDRLYLTFLLATILVLVEIVKPKLAQR